MIISVCIMWLFCYILTIAGAFPEDKSTYGFEARTDIRLDVIDIASWIRFPYPGIKFDFHLTIIFGEGQGVSLHFFNNCHDRLHDNTFFHLVKYIELVIMYQMSQVRISKLRCASDP